MKSFAKHIILILLPAMLLLAGCTDDNIDSPYPGRYPDGETMVGMRLDFEPFASSKVAPGRGVSGKLMDKLDDLCVVAYDLNGKLMEGFPVEITPDTHNLEVTDIDRADGDASNGQLAEKRSKQATFKLKVPHGRFYLYGVANLGRYQDENRVSTTYEQLTTGEFKEAVKTREGLLGAKTSWDSDNWRNNCEMLGYFSNGKDKSPSTGADTNNRTVSIDRPGLELHSWLRRCASKVTIDFDGSGLRENIYVYIKRATIHDIPASCKLGNENAAASEKELISYKDDNYRPLASDFISYGDGDDYHSWPRISKGAPYIMENDTRKDFHDENAQALFLYENMQGESEDERNKEQQPAPDGSVIGADEKKDNMPYGSYIEVEAYYDLSSNTQVSTGKIIYRFMLGKDVLKDFNVERNHHYKITMCIRGNGNDVDWHIEYNEESGFEIRNPYYVSYLYNHDSTLRFRYTPPEGRTVSLMTAEIVGNNWWPDGKSSYNTQSMSRQNPLKEGSDTENPKPDDFSKNKYSPTDAGYDSKLEGRTKYLGNGFLSLWSTEKTVIEYKETSKHPDDEDKKNWATFPANEYMNDRYFYGISKDSKDRSRRTYYFDGTPDSSNKGREAYEVEKEQNGSLRFNIPMFTRAKNLVKETGYTGNNPYEESTRSAYVKVTVTLDDNSTESEILHVKQVKRIVNPKGIYRKSKNNEDFHVTLMNLSDDDETQYIPFESDGPWMAEVIGDENFINLNGKSTIKGSTGSEIDFNIRFNKMNLDNKIRNAIIRIRYHNYSCVHLIYVRQGYSSQKLIPPTTSDDGKYYDGAEWHTCNMIYRDKDADDPRDEGSLFKLGNLTTPIDVRSNKNSKTPWINISPADFNVPGMLDIAKADGSLPTESLAWSDIKGSNDGFQNSNVAEISDFEEFYRISKMEQGFGILYADGATYTQRDIEDAYGYYRHDEPAVRNKRGMFGVFMYYWDKENTSDPYNCRNIFFPIGRSGYGHRRHWDGNNRNGVLRYSVGRTEEFPQAAAYYQPLFHDLYMRRGAIYWSKMFATGIDASGVQADNGAGLDLNFFTFDVSIVWRSNIQKNSQWSGSIEPEHLDACFVRCVGQKSVIE